MKIGPALLGVIAGSGRANAGCTNGPTWAAMTLQNRNHNSVAYGGGRFVVGEIIVAGGVTAAEWSTDGSTWNASATVPNNAGTTANDVSFGNGIFLAQRDAITALSSTDGDTWAARTMPSQIFGCLSFANGLFLLGGIGTGILTTPDGVAYTARTAPAASVQSSGFSYGNGVWVSIGGNGAAYSSDAATWLLATTPAPWDATSQLGPLRVAYGVGIFVAVGSTSASNAYFYSTNGTTWTAGTLPATNQWRDVIYAQGVFLCCSITNADLAISTDGLNWSLSGGGYDFTDAGGFSRMATDGAGVYAAIKAGANTLGNVGAC